MTIRPAIYADLIPAAKILALAFHDEPLHGPLMHPHRNKYPNDVYLFYLAKLRKSYFSGPSHTLLIAHPLGQPLNIVGAAAWERQDPHASPLSWPRVALLTAVSWYTYFESWLFPNRAADKSQLDILDRAGPFVAHFWTGSRGDVYNLSILGVSPEFSKRGFGKELVEWGFARASEEGVGCSVVSSEGNAAFYERCGFDVMAGICSDSGGNENPLRNVPGGTVHFWDNGRSLDGVKQFGEK